MFLPPTLQCEYRSINKSKNKQFGVELKIHISGPIDNWALEEVVLLHLCFKNGGRILLVGCLLTSSVLVRMDYRLRCPVTLFLLNQGRGIAQHSALFTQAFSTGPSLHPQLLILVYLWAVLTWGPCKLSPISPPSSPTPLNQGIIFL